MKYFFLLFILATASFAQAKGETTSSDVKVQSHNSSPEYQFQIFLYSPELRYERGEDQSIEQRKAHSYSVALRRGMFSGLLEYTNFSEKTGNPALAIDREHQDYLAWGRVHFYSLNENYIDFSLYAGVGVGFYNETIKTTLDGNSVQDNGGNQLEGALSLGLDSTIFMAKNFGVVLGAELRLLAGRDFDPNPQFSGLVRVGIQF